MTTDFRALCANLTAALNDWQCETGDDRYEGLLDRARALLAEPEAVGPGDEELDELFTEIDQGGECLSWRAYARAALDRWGRPAAAPVPEPGEVPRIGHILRLAEIIREVDGRHDKGAAALAEAILSHPGICSAGLAALDEADGPAVPDGREPASVALQPSDGEVVELVVELRRICFDVAPCDADAITRAADLLAQRHPAPVPVLPDDALIIEPAEHTLLVPVAQPVPVSERLPGPVDCDAEDNCWWFDPHADGAWYLDTYQSCYTHWLPANALPLPTPETTDV